MFDAVWTCQGNDVVCMATDTTNLERRVVGDRVCSTRGIEKPDRSTFTAAVADQCEPVPLSAGDYPSAQCMAVFEDRIAQRAGTTTETEQRTDDDLGPPLLNQDVFVESFALPATLLGLAAFFA